MAMLLIVTAIYLCAHDARPGYIKQIAGRAGRLSSEYEYGEVTSWQEMDLAYIRSIMNFDVPSVKSAGIFPSVEQIDLFSRELLKHQNLAGEGRGGGGEEEEEESVELAPEHDNGDDVESLTAKIEKTETEFVASDVSTGTSLVEHTRLSLLMKKFVETSQTSGDYFLCEHSDLMRISNWLNSIPLTLTDRYSTRSVTIIVLYVCFFSSRLLIS
jgi:hypothetical protein